MARHAILSDVHANFEALQAVYRDIARDPHLHSIVSLGDLVGYGPNPAEAIAGLNSLTRKGYTVRYCMGNHDAAAVGRYEFVDLRDPADLERLATEAGLKELRDIGMHYKDPKKRKYIPVTANAKLSIQWTAPRLAEPYRQFIIQNSKDHLILTPGVLCVHASPRDPLFHYVVTGRNAQKALDAPLMAGITTCFIGHTHVPGIWQLRAELLVRFAANVICMEPPRAIKTTKLQLHPESTITIVNVGSVGQSRDGNPAAAYAVYDDTEQTVELRRVPYDLEATRRKILAAGLPPALAERLGAANGERGVASEDPDADPQAPKP